MNVFERTQKKKIVFACLYALIIVGLVIASAVLIASINKTETIGTNPNLNVDFNDKVPVSAPVFVLPLKDATVAKDYSATELQYNDTLKQWEIHKAIDFIVEENNSVYAITDGVVSDVFTNYLEGTVVEITHSNGLKSVYKSLAEASAKVGDKVSAGQTIGKAGESMAQELNSGAHLHFEMFKNGKKVNPNDYLDLGTK